MGVRILRKIRLRRSCYKHLNQKYRRSNEESDREFEDVDHNVDSAISILYYTGELSTPLLQRRLRIVFGRASKIIEMLHNGESFFR